MEMQKLAQFGYCYAAALLVASVLGAGNLAWCFPVLLILLIVGLCVGPLRRNQTFWCIVSAAVLAFGAFFCYTRAVYEPMERLEGRTVTVKAMVEDYNSRYGMYNYEIKLLEVDGHAVVPTGAVYSVRENLDASYGDMIETQMKFTANRPAEGRVLGDYYKSHGLFLKSYLVYESDPKVSPVSGFNLQAAFHTLRDRLSDSVRQYMPTQSAKIATGMLLGGSSNLDDVTRTTFSRAGITHLFSVSGLHLTIVIQLAMGFFALLRLNKRLASGIGIFAVTGFIFLAGCTPSVLRAGITMLILLTGQIFKRPTSGLNSLGIACLLIALPNPYSMYDIGFLLSVTATLGILLFARPLSDLFCRRLRISGTTGRNVVSLFTVSMAAVLGTLPVNLLCFEEVSLVGILLNPVINLFVSIAMFTGFATAFFGLIPFMSPFASLFGAICSWAVTAISRGADLTIKLPLAYLPLGNGYIQIWFVLSVAGYLFYRIFWRNKPKALAAVTTVSVLLLVIPFAADRYLTMHSIAVTSVCSEDQSGFLIQAGGINVVFGSTDFSSGTALRRELMSKGVKRIDLYIQPDGKRRTGQVAEDFADIFEIKYFALNEEAINTQSYPYELKEEQLVLTKDADFTYPGETEIKIVGEEKPILKIYYQGELFVVTLDLKDVLPALKEDSAKLIAAAASTTDRDDIPAEHILLSSPWEGIGDQKETVIPAYESTSTTLLYPDWGGFYQVTK